MSADHRRPLFAFFVVASVCALLIGQGIRTEGILDFIVGRSATPAAAAVAEPVTLTPRPDRPTAPTADSGEDVGPTRSGSAGNGAAKGDRPGRRGPAPQASDSAHGPGKSSRAHDRQPNRGQGKGHGSHARGDDGSGKNTVRGTGRGNGKGHATNPGKGRDKGPNQSQDAAHGHVPDHAQGPHQ